MANATATYSGDEITVSFSATIKPDWDGAGQPLVDVSDIEIENLNILGIDIPTEQFNLFPESLQAHILELADDLTFEGELEDDGDYAYEMSRDE